MANGENSEKSSDGAESKPAFAGLQEYREQMGRNLEETVILKPDETIASETERLQLEINQTKAEINRIIERMQEFVDENSIDLKNTISPEILAPYGDGGREFTNLLNNELPYQKKKLQRLESQLGQVEIDPANYRHD